MVLEYRIDGLPSLFLVADSAVARERVEAIGLPSRHLLLVSD